MAFKKALWIALCVAASAIGIAGSDQASSKLKLRDLPAPVQAVVKEHSKGGQIRGLAKEVANGKTVYEAELTVNGYTKDIIVDPQGKVLVVEEQTSMEQVPEPARAALTKGIGTGKLLRVEVVTGGGRTSYEAQYVKGGKRGEVHVDPQGKPLK
jgi:uncharacterized cupredoxin-like copper-binding protein